ncbi:hypothetical protein [Occallatibacter riparius]|uniref:Uncharacterized protein n=1 Tax=Occallatibacter riparius TaxID=1002689 RepID=A0A9J7BZ75_9BACT|nr:hypothetical protein [Occallatibacter riparius]UWZ86902.1 hypothetical protein MOP44_13355 [Occallatibacter riparius]
MLETALWLLGVALEAVIIVLLVHRRIARPLPVFLIFCIWNLSSDLASRFVGTRYGYSSQAYFRYYVTGNTIDTLVLLAVLIELTWSVIRPYRSSLSRKILLGIAIGVIAVGCAIWPFTGVAGLHVPKDWVAPLRIQQTSATLRILYFLALAAMSQVLGIGWRNRELQIATGLGFYSLMLLGATMLHTHHASQALFHAIDIMVAASYVCSLVYWVISFSQQEAPRQEFSPRMQTLLFTVAGAARAGRVGLEEERRKVKR